METTLSVELDIGLRLRLLRKALGLTQTDAGAIMGVGQDTVSVWETGKREPGEGSLRLMADKCLHTGRVFNWLVQGGKVPNLTITQRRQGPINEPTVEQAFQIVRAEVEVSVARQENPAPEAIGEWLDLIEKAIQEAEAEALADQARDAKP